MNPLLYSDMIFVSYVRSRARSCMCVSVCVWRIFIDFGFLIVFFFFLIRKSKAII